MVIYNELVGVQMMTGPGPKSHIKSSRYADAFDDVTVAGEEALRQDWCAGYPGGGSN